MMSQKIFMLVLIWVIMQTWEDLANAFAHAKDKVVIAKLDAGTRSMKLMVSHDVSPSY